MLLNQVLGLLREHELVAWSRIDTIWLVSDCGPHFRSYESAAHYLYTLVRKLQVKVHILYLGEQHGKGACDRLFGWCNTWVQAYLQQHPVHGIDNLVSAYQAGSANMMQQDPAGAKFLVRIFDPGQVRPSSRFSLVCASLKISRTYSLSARVNRFAASGVTICNNVFSDLVADQALGSWSVEETVSPEPESWRRGFYDKPRSWELEGPKAGDKTDLTRKFATQKDHQIGAMPNPKRSIEEKLSAKARNLSRMAAKRRRRQATLGRTSGNARSSSSSSSTSSSSSSSQR